MARGKKKDEVTDLIVDEVKEPVVDNEEPEVPFVIDPEEEEPVKPKKQTKKNTQYVVTLDDPDSFLNVRTGAGFDYPNSGILYHGDIITTSNIPEDGWLKIDQGYVLFSKLKEVQ